MLQRDFTWCGGLTSCRKIAAAAEAVGIRVIVHDGNTAFGYHFSYAMPAVPWCDYFVGSPRGIPREEREYLPGQALPHQGPLVPHDGPGLGLDIPEAWLVPFFRP